VASIILSPVPRLTIYLYLPLPKGTFAEVVVPELALAQALASSVPAWAR